MHGHEQINLLIARLEQHQASAGLSDTQFASRYSKWVGSHKTWVDRLKKRNFAELGEKLAHWQARLQALVNELDGVSSAEIFETLPVVKYAAMLYQRLQGQLTDRRNALLVGIQGIGKTIALRHLARQYPEDAVFVTANECWKDSRMEIASGFARALGKSISASAAATFRAVLEDLKFHPRTILIDEAHEGGVLLLKLVKTLINESRSRTILAIYPTCWFRLINGSNEAYAEAQQLLRRTIKPVRRDWFAGVTEADVAAYLAAAKPFPAGHAAAAKRYTPLLAPAGGLSLLQDAIDLAELLQDSRGVQLTAESLEARLKELLGQQTDPEKEKEAA